MSNLLATTESNAGAVLICAIVTACGVAYAVRSGEPRRNWSLPRTPTPNDAAPVWVGFVVLLAAYVYVPALLAQWARPASGATTVPSTQPVDAAVLLVRSTIVYAVGLLGVVGVHAFMRSPVRRLLGIGRPTRSDVRLLITMSLAAIPATYLTSAMAEMAWQQLGWTHPQSHPLLDLMRQESHRPHIQALAILIATVFAPIFEEVFFRGHLQTGIASATRTRWMAIVFTSLVFAAIHPWWTIPPIFVLSVCLGYLYERTGNLWMPIALHVAFNAISTTLYLTLMTT